MTYGMLIDLKKCIGCHALPLRAKRPMGHPIGNARPCGDRVRRQLSRTFA